jgi:hypothetical protein
VKLVILTKIGDFPGLQHQHFQFFCGVGVMLQRYKHQKHSKCPRCMLDAEDTSHVLQCQHADALTLWQQLMDHLENWMITNQGHPEMVELIILGLNAWHSSTNLPLDYDILEPSLNFAYRKQ